MTPQSLFLGLRQLAARRPASLLMLIVALPLANALAYAWVSANRVITRDQWFFLPMLQDFFAGHFHPISLWLTHSQHRTPAYKLLFLLDALSLRLDLRSEIMLGTIALGLTVLLLMRRFRDSLPDTLPPLQVSLGLACIALMGLSLNQWANLVYALEALSGYTRIAFFVSFWIALDVRLKRGASPGETAALAALLAFILLGWAAAHGPAYLVATFLCSAAALRLDEGDSRRGFKLLGWLAVSAAASEAVYWLAGPLAPLQGSAGGLMHAVLRTPWRVVEYGLMALCSSAMPIEGMQNHGFPHALSLLMGALIGAVYLAAGICFVRARLWRASTLPAFLMSYSLLTIASVFLARFMKEGLENASAPRYVMDTQLGIIGCFWTLFLWRARRMPTISLMDKVTAVPTLFSAILLLEVVIAGMIWRHNAYQRQLFEQAVEQVRSEDFGAPGWVCPDAALCRSGTEFLKQERLNIFNSDAADDGQDKTKLVP
ncbi:MAG TPA: hypothetical protein VLG68_11020 [Gammaproteobacteria bacterium]|nr:hypothetical protein [Gammaproteobacteria bacterium]